MLAHFQVLEIGGSLVPQRLIVYILACNIFRPSNETYVFLLFCFSSDVITSLSGELNATLKKYQDRDLLNQMRSQANIKNQLLTIFWNASQVCRHVPFYCYLRPYWFFQAHREKEFEDLLKKLLFLDSIALSANVEALITDEDTYEDLVETTGPGAQSLVNLLQAVCLRVICTSCYIDNHI